MKFRTGMPTLALLALLSSAGRTAVAQMDKDALEVKNYRLSMAVLNKIGSVYQNLFTLMQQDPKAQALGKAKAEFKKLEAKQEPTEAEQKRMETLAEEIEKREEQLSSGVNLNEAKTLSEMARKIESIPPYAAAIRQAGMTPREFSTAQLALFQSMLALSLTKSGTVKELPKEVSAENVKFLRDNEAAVTALMAEWQKLSKEP